MMVDKPKTFKECPNCRAPITEAKKLTCRRCGHYLHLGRDGLEGMAPVSALLGLLIVAAVGGFACYVLLLKPHEQPPAGAGASRQAPFAETAASAGKRIRKHHRH